MTSSRSERSLARPRGLLFDYGGTLVEEVAFDVRAGVDVLLAHAIDRPPNVSLDAILARVERIGREVSARRDETQVETPWPAITRLIYDYFGICFTHPLLELELAFWDASVTTRPMPGVYETLVAIRDGGLPMAVVSNSSFRGEVIRYELAKHGLAEFFTNIISSADYAVRKPNPLLLEVAAALIDVRSSDVWFVGDRLDTDVAGARAAGMQPVWFVPSAATAGDDALATVRDWTELLVALRGLAH
jgi:putative hydrolase of the HAD superfamily